MQCNCGKKTQNNQKKKIRKENGVCQKSSTASVGLQPQHVRLRRRGFKEERTADDPIMRVANTVSHFVRSLFCCCTLAYYTRLVVGKDIQTDKKNTHAIVRRSEKTTKLYNIVCVTGTIATTNERHCSNRLQISTAKCFLNLATRSNNNKTYPTFYYSKMSPMPKNMTYF